MSNARLEANRGNGTKGGQFGHSRNPADQDVADDRAATLDEQRPVPPSAQLADHNQSFIDNADLSAEARMVFHDTNPGWEVTAIDSDGIDAYPARIHVLSPDGDSYVLDSVGDTNLRVGFSDERAVYDYSDISEADREVLQTEELKDLYDQVHATVRTSGRASIPALHNHRHVGTASTGELASGQYGFDSDIEQLTGQIDAWKSDYPGWDLVAVDGGSDGTEPGQITVESGNGDQYLIRRDFGNRIVTERSDYSDRPISDDDREILESSETRRLFGNTAWCVNEYGTVSADIIDEHVT